MISCNLSRISRYDYQSPQFAAAMAFMQNTDLTTLEPGTVIPLMDGVVIRAMEYTTLPRESKQFEAHRNYFDIQIVVRGQEFMGLADTATLSPATEYDAENDIQMFHLPQQYGGLVLNDGDFVIVSPDDAHLPSCTAQVPCTVRKVVIKVHV